jgi:hypothetical protein
VSGCQSAKGENMIRKHNAGAFTLKKESTAPGPTIDRDQVLSKLWELANLTPEETKGSVTGQLNALEILCKELGYLPKKESAKPLPAPEIYRSAWMTRSKRVN